MPVPGSDAPGALTIAGIDPVAQIIPEGPHAPLNMTHGPLPHLLRVMAGILHVLLAELADHWTDLAMGGYFRPTKIQDRGSRDFVIAVHPEDREPPHHR